MSEKKEVYQVEIRRDTSTGIAMRETWFKAKRKHRSDGPADMFRDPVTGVVSKEAWFQNGRFHREGGPALILRDTTTGAIRFSQWYLDGEQTAAPRNSRPKLTKSKRQSPSSQGPST